MKKLRRLLSVKLARAFGRNENAAPVPSIVSEGTRIKGDIISNGIIHIDGKVDGDISCDELVIGLKGSVNGGVTTTSLQLYGVLSGKTVVDNLFVAKTAKLIGDATHNTIAIEPGAYIDGHCIRSNTSHSSSDNSEELVVVEGRRSRRA